MSRQPSEALDRARSFAEEIVTDRYRGESCRKIADRYNVPEHTIWHIMKSSGLAGRIHAKPERTRQMPYTLGGLVKEIESAADDLTIERTADETGWIATIDDLSGEAQDTIHKAVKSAFALWIREES